MFWSLKTALRACSGEGRYIGWAGDVAAQPGTLEVHPDFGRQLNLHDQDVVIAAEESVLHASTVRITPQSVDDWEVIEAHAAHLEQTLLSIIGVLSPKMVFPVWVGGGRPIGMQVGEDDQNTGASPGNRSILQSAI